MKRKLLAILNALKPTVARDIVAREPAIAAALASGFLTLGVRLGLHLNATQEAYVLPGMFLLLNWIVRQCVMPSTEAALRQRQSSPALMLTETPAVSQTPMLVNVSGVVMHHHHTEVPVEAATPAKRPARKPRTR